MSFDQWNNQADVTTLDNLKAQLAASQPKQNTNTHGNFFTHLLPTAGGTLGGVGGGALGGALAGSAILPGIGTAAGGLIGALLGGFAGGAGGKAVENKVEGQGIGNGVLGQGLEQGALSAGPLRLLKGAGALAKAAPEVTTGAKSLAEALSAAAGEKAAAPSSLAKNLVTQGQAAQGRVAGISAGSKEAGVQLFPQDTSRMLDTLKTEKIPIGNANNMTRDIKDKLNTYGQQINDYFTKNNQVLSAADKQAITDNYLKSLPSTDPLLAKKAQVVVNDFNKDVTDTKSMWKFRQNMDEKIPTNDQAKGSLQLTKEKLAAKTMRQNLSDALGKAPGMKQYHDLSEIGSFGLDEAARANNATGGIVGRIAASGPVQKTEQLLGKGTEAAGKALGGGNPFSLPAVAGRTVPIGMLQAGANSVQNPSMATTSSTTPTTMSNDNMGGLSQNSGDLSSQQSQSPYGQANLMYDINRDPRNADKYLTLYSSLDKIFNPSDSKTAIKPTSQQYGLAQGGMNALNQLSQLIQQDPSVINRNATLGQGLPVIGSLISNAAGAGSYHPLADSVLQSLIHLQTGATATPEEVKAARGQLPAPGDSPDEQQRKLQNLAQMFSPFVQGGNTAGTSNSPTDLASALAAMGYGQ